MTTGGSRWQEHARPTDGAAYAAHFQALADRGVDVHGEAALCDALVAPRSRILDAGCGTGRVSVQLNSLGHTCVGVDSDRSMLEQAQVAAPEVTWVLADLSTLNLGTEPFDTGFDLVVAAGNVIPLVAHGTEEQVVANLAAALGPNGLVVAGFGLDPEHLPLDFAPVDLASYDEWCEASGLSLVDRWATWAREPFGGGGYAVSVHQRTT